MASIDRARSKAGRLRTSGSALLQHTTPISASCPVEQQTLWPPRPCLLAGARDCGRCQARRAGGARRGVAAREGLPGKRHQLLCDHWRRLWGQAAVGPQSRAGLRAGGRVAWELLGGSLRRERCECSSPVGCDHLRTSAKVSEERPACWAPRDVTGRKSKTVLHGKADVTKTFNPCVCRLVLTHPG